MNNRESRCSFRVGVFCYRTNVAMSLQYIGNVMNTSFATLERITNNSCLLTQWILTKKLNFFAIKKLLCDISSTHGTFFPIYPNVHLNDNIAKFSLYQKIYSTHIYRLFVPYSIL